MPPAVFLSHLYLILSNNLPQQSRPSTIPLDLEQLRLPRSELPSPKHLTEIYAFEPGLLGRHGDGLDGRGSIFFSSPQRPNLATCSLGTDAISQELKQPEREAKSIQCRGRG